MSESSRQGVMALQRRSSRLSKQDEIEDIDEDNHVAEPLRNGNKQAILSGKAKLMNGDTTDDGVFPVDSDSKTCANRIFHCGDDASDDADVPTVDLPVALDLNGLSNCSNCTQNDNENLFISDCGELGNSVHKVIVSQDDSEDSDKSSPTLPGKLKPLVRCHAVCEDSSLNSADGDCVTTDTSSLPTSHSARSSSLLTPGGGSSLGSSTDRDVSPELSRDVSLDRQYTDNKGVDLEAFFKTTLNKSHSDRMMLLKLEQEMISFIKDDGSTDKKFGPLQKSYDRMLVHRVAAFFGLDHNVDASGKTVVVTKGGSARIPDFRFNDHFDDNSQQDDQPKKLLRRDPECRSFDETRNKLTLDGKKSKSFEERSVAYEQLRARLFNQPAEPQPSSSSSSSHLSPHNGETATNSAWVKIASRKPWSSTESGYATDSSSKSRGNVSKASSFSGVTLLRNDSHSSTTSSRLSKTDSTCSYGGTVSNVCSPLRPPPIPSSPASECQLSESSSNCSATISPALLCQEQAVPLLPFTTDDGERMSVWVASRLDLIPDGSIIINPNTGKPHLNADGTIFYWNKASLLLDKMKDEENIRSVAPCQTVASPSIGIDNLESDLNSQYSMPLYRSQQSENYNDQLQVLGSTIVAPSVSQGVASRVQYLSQNQVLQQGQARSSYSTVQQGMTNLSGMPYSYPLFNFPNMTVQSVEMYPSYPQSYGPTNASSDTVIQPSYYQYQTGSSNGVGYQPYQACGQQAAISSQTSSSRVGNVYIAPSGSAGQQPAYLLPAAQVQVAPSIQANHVTYAAPQSVDGSMNQHGSMLVNVRGGPTALAQMVGQPVMVAGSQSSHVNAQQPVMQIVPSQSIYGQQQQPSAMMTYNSPQNVQCVGATIASHSVQGSAGVITNKAEGNNVRFNSATPPSVAVRIMSPPNGQQVLPARLSNHSSARSAPINYAASCVDQQLPRDNSGSAMQQLMRGTMHLSLQSHQQPLSQQHLLSHKQRSRHDRPSS